MVVRTKVDARKQNLILCFDFLELNTRKVMFQSCIRSQMSAVCVAVNGPEETGWGVMVRIRLGQQKAHCRPI
jgi:hypothetical protein